MDDPAPRQTFGTARLAIAKLAVSPETPLHDACVHAARISSKVLDVARVGVWLFDEASGALRSHVLHEREPARGPRIEVLDPARFPRYVAALESHRWVCAPDAQRDSVTAELAEGYLIPLGITSMLDAPVFRSGRLFGIVCHEHIGPMREWSSEDQSFAGSVADILALLFEQAAHAQTQRERFDLERRLSDIDGSEVLARLSAGIAHDVNNLLATIEILLTPIERATDDPIVVRAAADVRSVVSAGVQVTQQLMGLARGGREGPAELDLGDTVRRIHPLLRAIVGQRYLLLVRASSDVVVRATQADIQRILVNLVDNACHASFAGATITIEVSRGNDPDTAQIAVIDQGSGIEESIRDRIFEPLFTTRPAEGGSGLGLSAVRAIVDRLGGRVEVESTLGRGCTFRVVLRRLS